VPDIPGARAENVFTLRSVEDGIRIRQAVTGGAKKAVIAGAGLIGLELAEELTGAGVHTEIIELMPRLLPFLPADYAQAVLDVLAANGVRPKLGRAVSAMCLKDGQAAGVQLDNGEEVPGDFVILAAGVLPNTGLAEDCGLRLCFKKGIVVDEAMRTSDPSIWACGDCVQMKCLLTGQPVYVPLGTTANKQGRAAGASIAGEAARFEGVLSSQAAKVFDMYIAVTGLTLEKARAAGFDAAEAGIVKSDKASYYPGGIDTRLNLVFERRGGRILGGQGIGGASVAGRINLLAAAVTTKMTLGQLNELDLVYTPSLAPVYDPLLIAAANSLKYLV
jgi:NADPH-dependent 2,4-dienoyl-CoA reductase/sulfur reductase-like enzyme